MVPLGDSLVVFLNEVLFVVEKVCRYGGRFRHPSGNNRRHSEISAGSRAFLRARGFRGGPVNTNNDPWGVSYFYFPLPVPLRFRDSATPLLSL